MRQRWDFVLFYGRGKTGVCGLYVVITGPTSASWLGPTEGPSRLHGQHCVCVCVCVC